MESRSEEKTPIAISIRPMSIGDVERVHEIERSAYTSPWPIDCFRGELIINQDARYIVAETDDGEVAGYCGVWLMGGEAHITNVAVAPEFRRMHIADRLLVNQLEFVLSGDSQSIFLEVRRHNIAAQKMYSRFRFTVCRVRERYYNDNDEDALELRVENVSDSAFLDALRRIKESLS